MRNVENIDNFSFNLQKFHMIIISVIFVSLTEPKI